ncbi:MAG: hypothetical protein ACREBQ_10625 [Nitrososphaerales archaeon]
MYSTLSSTEKIATILIRFALLTHSLQGKFGQPFTTDYVVLESTILFQRRLGAKVSLALLNLIETSGIKTVIVGDQYYKALTLFHQNFQRLSLCDAATLAVMNQLDIVALASYDERSFNGLVGSIYGKSYFSTLPQKDKETVKSVL